MNELLRTIRLLGTYEYEYEYYVYGSLLVRILCLGKIFAPFLQEYYKVWTSYVIMALKISGWREQEWRAKSKVKLVKNDDDDDDDVINGTNNTNSYRTVR